MTQFLSANITIVVWLRGNKVVYCSAVYTQLPARATPGNRRAAACLTDISPVESNVDARHFFAFLSATLARIGAALAVHDLVIATLLSARAADFGTDAADVFSEF
ncbi:MAG: hypothetical protein ABS95_02635 [Verrucomicrobia bacterium SCN 57-15]|nr:MAG: hypothetical protein ABS95_02635 [Verrucomicrobia bacterium SCN 57-15]